MNETRFTALGMSGSGKTCYVLGMYYQMCIGIKGFSIVTKNQTASMLEDWMDKLDDETGMERFPAGTALTEIMDYYFQLNYQNQEVFSFDWIDYGGGTLKQRENNPEAFESLNNSIINSTALYIFLDGQLLACENYDQKLNNIQRKVARTVNSYVTEFEHSKDSKIPPIIFVITKSDICAPYLKEGEMQKIIKESFSPAFGKDKKNYIVAVSLGHSIAEDDYSGEVKPINIHIPFFLGIYHEFYNYSVWLKNQIKNDINNGQRMIANSQAAISRENNKFFSFMRNNSSIDSNRRFINETQENIQQLEKELVKNRRLLGAVVSELDRVSNSFITFYDGKEIEFSHDEIYDL